MKMLLLSTNSIKYKMQTWALICKLLALKLWLMVFVALQRYVIWKSHFYLICGSKLCYIFRILTDCILVYCFKFARSWTVSQSLPLSWTLFTIFFLWLPNSLEFNIWHDLTSPLSQTIYRCFYRKDTKFAKLKLLDIEMGQSKTYDNYFTSFQSSQHSNARDYKARNW